MKVEAYIHNVKFYETDKMNITHHSNYVRWMEEARINFMEKVGCDYRELEKVGISSPVVSVKCDFIKTTTFGDDVYIYVSVKKFNGVRFWVSYEMKCNNEIVLTAESQHCFVKDNMQIINLKKEVPDYYNRLADASKSCDTKKVDSD